MQNTIFSDIESSEYRLLAHSSLTIRGQQFDDDVFITEGDSQITGSIVEIVGSGAIQVREGGDDDDDDNGEEDDSSNEEEDAEVNPFNIDIQPYRRTLSDGDMIIVSSMDQLLSEIDIFSYASLRNLELFQKRYVHHSL